MSPDADNLKAQIKQAEQLKRDAQKRIAEEKKQLKDQMAEHDRHMAEIRKEKSKAAQDLSKLP